MILFRPQHSDQADDFCDPVDPQRIAEGQVTLLWMISLGIDTVRDDINTLGWKTLTLDEEPAMRSGDSDKGVGQGGKHAIQAADTVGPTRQSAAPRPPLARPRHAANRPQNMRSPAPTVTTASLRLWRSSWTSRDNTGTSYLCFSRLEKTAPRREVFRPTLPTGASSTTAD